MAEGARVLDADERRVIREALIRAAADTRTVRSAYEVGGGIAKPLKLSPEEIDSCVRRFDRIIAAQEHLAAEFGNPTITITVTEAP